MSRVLALRGIRRALTFTNDLDTSGLGENDWQIPLSDNDSADMEEKITLLSKGLWNPQCS